MSDDSFGRSGGGVSRRKFIAAAGATGAASVAGCTETEGTDDGGLSGSINIAGSSTVYPLMTAIAEEFTGEHGDVRIDISSTGSGGGFQNHFCPGNTDFNDASRPIKPEEEQLCAENGVEYVELVVATDALTVVVANENDFATALSVEELAQIWEADAVETWSGVRDEWPDEEIVRYGADDTSGTFDYFVENIMGSERGHTDDYQATENDNTIVQGVSGDPYAIGYFGYSYYHLNPDAVQAVAVDDGDGPVEPNLDTAASGEYSPLSRSLYTYPSIDSLGAEHVAEFARYVLERSTDESLVAEDVGYVPNTEETAQAQLDALETAIEEAQG